MSGPGFPPQPLPQWRRAVLKVGSSLLAGEGGLDPRHAAAIGRLIMQSRAKESEIGLVPSGAVREGRSGVGSGGDGLLLRQALAALAQAPLVSFWQHLLDVPVAQVLLTHDDLRNRRRYLN